MPLKKTLPKSLDQIIKGVRSTQNQCNSNAIGVLGLTVKLKIDDYFPEKRLLLPTKLPNEF